MNNNVEFAKWMLGKSIIARKADGTEHIYHPNEFNLMLGELTAQGDKLYDEFLTSQEIKEDMKIEVVTIDELLELGFIETKKGKFYTKFKDGDAKFTVKIRLNEDKITVKKSITTNGNKEVSIESYGGGVLNKEFITRILNVFKGK